MNERAEPPGEPEMGGHIERPRRAVGHVPEPSANVPEPSANVPEPSANVPEPPVGLLT